LHSQNALILVCSYVFYGWWNWKFPGLLILSTLIDYGSAFLLTSGSSQKRKFFLALSLLNNLLVLCIFKYYNFFVGETQHFLTHWGVDTHPWLIKVILPVGISFYTFHGMSYVIDVYRGNLKPVRSFIDYSVFVSFFPLLVAGPIERATHLIPQIQRPRTFNYQQAVQGLRLMLWGFFKKFVIANTLAPVVDIVFENYTHYPGSVLVLGAIYFSFQIYCDFSGYTDIALGVAKLFGFELLTNFKFPYFSRDLAEFWRRWHISLTSWFRDYIYIPLGGSKKGKLKTVRNIFLVFLISGLWHGANWTYIAWGAIHALGFLPLLLRGRNRMHTGPIVAHNGWFPRLGELASMFGTFCFVTLAWVFFRSDTISNAIQYLSAMPRGLLKRPSPIFTPYLYLYVIPFVVIDWCFRKNERDLPIFSWRIPRYLVYALALFLILAHTGNDVSFIYFQF
jgi:alginate O-acetyltransferase complex protein AlgI